jgi:hypothetical protein
MAKYSRIEFNFPDINRAYINASGTEDYSKPNIIAGNKKTANSIKNVLGKFISKWSEIFELSDEILISFIATESGGKNAPRNKFNAIGYTQSTPISVFESVTKWQSMVGSVLPSEAKDILSKNIPNWTKWVKNVYKDGDANYLNLVTALSSDAEFNVAMGALQIRWLLEAYDKDGGSPLNKVMVSYNRGYPSTKNIVKGNFTSAQMMKLNLGIEAKSYLLKMLGRYGFLSITYGKV